ncbi:MAG TPA: ribonuclease III [Chloroflexota bacterium]|jgi:ribonuclease-3|nr:ribonuclease III [Chloroflexota bacterium]
MPEGRTAVASLGLHLAQPELLRQALTVARPGEADPRVRAKERLEYLGDVVIAFLVTDHLFRTLPEAPEGVLSALRAAAVSAPALAAIAEAIGVPEALQRPPQHRERGRTRLLAATLEALVGALYCDAGLTAADDWIGPHLVATIDELQARGYLPAKTRLQEHTQHGGRGTPYYRVAAVSGAVHERTYTVEVLVEGQVLGTGRGPSRRAAEQAAAEEALDRLG